MWARGSFTASAANILNGDEKYAGVGISRRAYFNAMARLEELGLISRKSAKGERATITLHVDWEPQDSDKARVISEDFGRKAPQKAGAYSAQGGAQDALVPCNMCTQNKGSKSKDINKVSPARTFADAQVAGDICPGKGVESLPTQASFPGSRERVVYFGAAKESSTCDPQPVQHAVIAVRQRITQKQIEDRKRRAKQADTVVARPAKPVKTQNRDIPKVTVADIERVWVRAAMESHPMRLHMTWSRKEAGMVKTAMKKWAEGNHGTFPEFVDYAVRHWGTICRRKFKWMTHNPAPDYPNVGFFIARLTDFLTAWIHDEATKFATDAENADYDRLRVSGMSHDEALIEMAKRESRSAMRAEMERREENVRRLARQAKEDAERAARLDGLADKIKDSPAVAGLEVIPGQKRRPGQVWGHQPIIRAKQVETPPQPAPERPAPSFIPDPSQLIMIPKEDFMEAVRRGNRQRFGIKDDTGETI